MARARAIARARTYLRLEEEDSGDASNHGNAADRLTPRQRHSKFPRETFAPWGPARRWEMFLLDAYAPGLTDNVQRFGWLRGYIVFTHGGGASMVAQTNDTVLHQWTRRRFIEKQTALLLREARTMGGGLVEATREDRSHAGPSASQASE